MTGRRSGGPQVQTLRLVPVRIHLLLSELIRLVFRHGSPLDAQGDIIPPPRKKGGRKFLFRQNHVPQIGGVRRDKMDQALDDPNLL